MDKIKIVGLAVISVILVLLGFYRAGSKAGKQAVEIKQIKHTKKVMKEVQNVEKDINTMSADTVRSKLRNKWTRDDD